MELESGSLSGHRKEINNLFADLKLAGLKPMRPDIIRPDITLPIDGLVFAFEIEVRPIKKYYIKRSFFSVLIQKMKKYKLYENGSIDYVCFSLLGKDDIKYILYVPSFDIWSSKVKYIDDYCREQTIESLKQITNPKIRDILRKHLFIKD